MAITFSSSALSPLWDVFLSFYGKDTRRNFIANLYFALDQAGISTFRDDPALEKGLEISSGLLNAIKDSKMFVVVISRNYARSPWCLNELVEIIKCKKTKNQIIPIFYYVDPCDLRHLKESFGEALDYHRKRNHPVDTIDKWKSALAEIAELSGYHLKEDANENEAYTVQEIVEHLESQTSTKRLHLEEYLVGIDSAVEEIYQKFLIQSNDVRLIGICGMGGIGKTTIAKVFYDKYVDIFDVGCFIENVKQYSQGGSPPPPLLQQILRELLRRKSYMVSNVQSGIRQLQRCLHSKKALIILDDLDQSSHMEWLERLCKMLSPGSRIVITTRDVSLLIQLKVDIPEVDTYMVKKMEQKDSLELFSYHAFRKQMPPDSFRELSVSFVTYAEGLPLALKVLGSSLRGRTDMLFWKDKLKMIQEFSEYKISKILRLSYDELANEREKEIFLDIVFFFVGKDKDEAVHIFRSCDFFPDVGIPILVDRCLIRIDHDNKFQMHNLIQDMGKEIIREKSKHGKGTRRLYLGEESEYQALKNLEGANKIEGLILNLSMSRKKEISAKVFKRFPNLRLLEVISAHDITGNFENSFYELRCIRWYHCPWTCLPSSFRPQKLVFLDMPFNELKTLWKTPKLMQSLKIINMSYSKNLKRTPDFRDLNMVEKLCFRGSKSLQKVHPSIGQLINLHHLDMGDCNSLKELPEPIGELNKLGNLELGLCINLTRLPQHIKQLTSLGSLNLADCKNLKWLPEQLGDMKGLKMLDASYTAIELLPDSIVNLKGMISLNLAGCKKLRKLPEQLGNMDGLQKFIASDSGIEELPDSIGRLVNLAYLGLYDCKNLNELPFRLWNRKLVRLRYLDSCTQRESLHEQLGKMNELHDIQELPDSVGLLSRLQVFELSRVQLKKVPNDTWDLTSLVKVHLPCDDIFTSNLPVMNQLEHLSLRCNIRLWLPTVLGFSSLKVLYLCDEEKSLASTKWFSLSKLSNLEILTLDNWGTPFLELPPNLTRLNLRNHATLEQLPDLSNLEHLESLDIWNCINLQLLPPFPLNLKELYVADCTNLKDEPDHCDDEGKSLSSFSLSKLSKLERLTLENWGSYTLKVPLNLTDLNLRSHKTLEKLPDLSNLEFLQSLELLDCINLRSLPPLPLNLQSLRFYRCTSLQSLPPLPLNLQVLYFYKCTTLQLLSPLPLSLQSLSFEKCTSLQSVPPLPLNLQSLSFEECTSLQSVPPLPLNLQSLSFEECTDIRSIPPLPLNLQSLSFHKCTGLQSLPLLPLNLQSLSFNKCTGLQSLPLLPLNLQSFSISGCTSLQSLPLFPLNLTSLVIHNCTSLKEVPDLCDESKSWSSFTFSKLCNLKKLELDNWGSSFLELPLNLKSLNLINYATLEQLPDLSNLKHLKTLDIENCASLQSLPPLPPSLKSLYVCECNSLKDVPDMLMLKDLKFVSIDRCSNLEPIYWRRSQLEVPTPDSNSCSLKGDHIPNREIAECFNYKSRLSTVPSFLRDMLSGLVLFILFAIAVCVVFIYRKP